MLKEIYFMFGTVGTFFIAIAMCVTILSWWLAVTGLAMREIATWKKLALILGVSFVPPLSLGMLVFFTIQDRKATPQFVPGSVRSIVLHPGGLKTGLPQELVAGRVVA